MAIPQLAEHSQSTPSTQTAWSPRLLENRRRFATALRPLCDRFATALRPLCTVLQVYIPTTMVQECP